MNEANKKRAKRIAKERVESGLRFCTYCGVDLNKARSIHHFHCNKAECIALHHLNRRKSEIRERNWHREFENRIKRKFAKELIDSYREKFGSAKGVFSLGYTPSKWFEDMLEGAVDGKFDRKLEEEIE